MQPAEGRCRDFILQDSIVSCMLPCLPQEYLPLGQFSEIEAVNFGKLKSELQSSIQKGIDFAHKGASQLNFQHHDELLDTASVFSD